MTDLIHPNLKKLSYSSRSLLHACPRKYELYKLNAKQREESPWLELEGEEAVPVVRQNGNVHFDFGSLVGDATQHYLVYGDIEATIFHMFCSWGRDLDDEGFRGKKGKTFFHAVHALLKFTTFRDTALSQWDVAYFNEKPAVELGYTIDCGDGFVDRGFLDALLVNKLTGGYAVYEGKTTGMKFLHEAMYRNSGQGLAYDLVLETISGKRQESYPVFYAVYTTGNYEWNLLPFAKTALGRANWIRDLLLDKQHVAEYAEGKHFPMHGNNCFNFNRECEYFGECEMSNRALLLHNVPEVKDDMSRYSLHFSIDKIIEDQLNRLED